MYSKADALQGASVLYMDRFPLADSGQILTKFWEEKIYWKWNFCLFLSNFGKFDQVPETLWLGMGPPLVSRLLLCFGAILIASFLSW